jgi:CBS domain containing-hemolysin-like protein
MDEPASYLATFLDGITAVAPPSPTRIFLKLLAVLILVGANGFFVASEFALVSVRSTKLEARATAGKRGARAALRLLDNPTLFISATQLGITLASLALGWIGEPTIASLLDPVAHSLVSEGRAGYVAHVMAIAVAFFAITFLHIVLGELMPKMIALDRAELLALSFSRPLELFARIFRTPLWVFNKTGTTLGRLIGLKSGLDHAAVYTEAKRSGIEHVQFATTKSDGI